MADLIRSTADTAPRRSSRRDHAPSLIEISTEIDSKIGPSDEIKPSFESR